MPYFIFTYGSEGHPFVGGWTQIEAEDMNQACSIFRVFHPNKNGNALNCAGVYSEDDFQQTEMCHRYNFGAGCHESIQVRRVLF